MAENRNSRQDNVILNDDSFKEAYRAGLDQLKASDELIQTTLNKCRLELESTAKKKRPINISFSRIALRYAAPFAACLLVLVLLLYSPMRESPKTADSAPAPGRWEQPMGSADTAAAESLPSADIMFTDELRDGEPQYTEEQAGTDSAPPDGREKSFMHSFTSGDIILNSMDFHGIRTPVGGHMPSEAVNAILDAYNSERGTQYTCDENSVLTFSTLKAGGIGADALREATGFGDLLGDQRYYLLPLQDESQEYAILLPAIETAVPYDDTSVSQPLDIVFSQGGRTWLTSQYIGIYTSHSHAAFLLDREGHIQLVRDTFNVGRITDYITVDINCGHDFIIIIEADDEEYAIPCIDTGSVGSIENNKPYPARDVINGLADSLVAQ